MEGDGNTIPPDKTEDDHNSKRFRQNSPEKSETTTTTVNTTDFDRMMKSIQYMMKRIDELAKVITDNGLQLPAEDEPMEIQEESFSSIEKKIQPIFELRPRIPRVNLSEVVFNNNNNNGNNSGNVSANNTRNRSADIPPIVVEDDGNRSKIWEDVRKITDKVTFSPINSKRYRICVTDNLENYQKVLDLVKVAGLKGNTYTPKEQKPISLIVRNLEYIDGLNEAAIKAEYSKWGVVVMKAVQWSTKMMASKNKFFWLV